eukprot:snap_masked-scaffold_41-processed-gene-1.7-mRNA-1 protein AED:0.30 eAED:0.31 QI:0/-1/0/1/-1/1/1/0/421
MYLRLKPNGEELLEKVKEKQLCSSDFNSLNPLHKVRRNVIFFSSIAFALVLFNIFQVSGRQFQNSQTKLSFVQHSDNEFFSPVSSECGLKLSVDVVIAYVNGSDPLWLEEKKQHSKEAPSLTLFEKLLGLFVLVGADSNSNNRFRDNQELKYSLRSIEKNMPWVRNVIMIVAQKSQVPGWLNTTNPQVRVVTHEEMFPGQYRDVLPVYSANQIEAHLVDIPGLSENFVYFNDDMLLARPVYLEDFVSQSYGQKIYFAWMIPFRMLHNSRLFDWKYFSGWFNIRHTIAHMPQFFSKKVFKALKSTEPFASGYEAMTNRFRTDQDMQLSFSYFHYLMYSGGKYILADKHEKEQVRFVALKGQNFEKDKRQLDGILMDRPKFVTINDEISRETEEADKTREYLHKTYETLFPEPSWFEIDASFD